LIDNFKNTHSKALFRCVHEHTWESKPNNVLNGSSCPKCHDLTIDIINERLTKNGISMIEGSSRVRESALFECEKSHQWKSKLGNVLNDHGCPICRRLNQRLVIDDISIRLAERGITLIDEYITSSTKVLFRCDKNHEWMSTMNNVLRNHGCPECTEYGINPNFPTYFYVLKFDTFVKYGITTNLKRRLGEHSSAGSYEIVMTHLFNNGKSARMIENKIKTMFVSFDNARHRMSNGFTETVNSEHLDRLLTEINESIQNELR
jgi:Zn finger protein HypA/HybF involved in hydrogenase expression